MKLIKVKNSKAMNEIIRMLLMKGGDSSIKNKQQKTVYDFADRALEDYKKLEETVAQQLVE